MKIELVVQRDAWESVRWQVMVIVAEELVVRAGRAGMDTTRLSFYCEPLLDDDGAVFASKMILEAMPNPKEENDG